MNDKHITRREFVAAASVAVAAPALAGSAKRGNETAKMKIGFHTDAFNSAYFSFEKCLEWAQKNDVHRIECGVIDGVS